MSRLKTILNRIDYQKEIPEQPEALKELNDLTEAEIDELFSNYGYVKYTEAGIAIQYLGYAKLKDKLPQLLEYLQDGNWPAFGHVARFFENIVEPSIPVIKKVFNDGDDSIWNYWILLSVVSSWDRKSLLQIEKELLKLVGKADEEGAAVYALEALQKIVSHDKFEQLYNYLNEKYKDDSSLLRDLRDLRSSTK